MGDSERAGDKPLVFISHVHEDEAYANFLQSWLDEALLGMADWFQGEGLHRRAAETYTKVRLHFGLLLFMCVDVDRLIITLLELDFNFYTEFSV